METNERINAMCERLNLSILESEEVKAAISISNETIETLFDCVCGLIDVEQLFVVVRGVFRHFQRRNNL